MSSIEALRRFINRWNCQFPIDYWYRQKYKIPFGSVVHRESLFIDQLIDFCENQMVNQKVEDDEYKPDRGQFLKKRKLSEKQIDDLFEKLGENEEI